MEIDFLDKNTLEKIQSKEKQYKLSRDARIDLALDGGSTGGRFAPYGYFINNDSYYEKKEKENEVIEFIFQLALKGVSPQNIGRCVKDVYDIRDSRRNYSSPTTTMILKILINPIYKGYPAFSMYENGSLKHPKLWIIRNTRLEHLAYVNEDLFDKANYMLWEKEYIQSHIKKGE